MANQAQNTEHTGPKKGCGVYWGRKKAAKSESNRVRRETDKVEVKSESGRWRIDENGKDLEDLP